MNILCTGSTGLVASDFKSHCQYNNIPFHGIDLHGEGESIDITNYDQLSSYIKKITNIETTLRGVSESHPFILFHFAAITITGKNLTPEQVDLTNNVNVKGTKNIVRACRELNIPLVHISTDFVFSGGNKNEPYLLTDPINPDDTVYSQSKAQAEELIMEASLNQGAYIVRLAFPYGNFSHPKKGLVRKMIDWMDSNEQVNLYQNQKTCPTPISHISKSCLKIAQLISENKINSGQVFHTVGKQTTPLEFGQLIKDIWNKPTQLNPINPEDICINMVLDITETEEILEIKSQDHQFYLKNLNK